MTCCIFAGPTLLPGDREKLPEAVWLPPAKQGDVLRVVSLLQPRAIGIIDGYFQWAPAVWHKEILWAMDRGVRVYGAASMGALRAAELVSFGMCGVGRIFEAYRAGVLAPYTEPFEDDDEVAVVHGPPESGYLAGSEAMINIRVTLAEAERTGQIDANARTALVRIGKALFYPDRSYDAVLKNAAQELLSPRTLEALRTWLPQGRINQKRADALELVEEMRAYLASDSPAPGPRFRFEHTTAWRHALVTHSAASGHGHDDEQVLDELRLAGDVFLREWRDAERSLFERGPAREAAPVVPLARDTDTILAERARAQALAKAKSELPRLVIEHRILSRLHADGRHASLLARAQRKQVCLSEAGDLPRVASFDGIELLQLEDWYFSECMGIEIPEDLDRYIDATGYSSRGAFHQAVFHEYVYRKALGISPESEVRGA